MAGLVTGVTGVNNSTMEGAVVNTTVSSPLNTSFHEGIADLISTTLSPVLNSTVNDKDASHRLTLKDETTVVSLIIMGVIVPTIFITVFVLICRQRRKDLQARRTQMLLQNAQDFALEDYTTVEKATSPPPKL